MLPPVTPPAGAPGEPDLPLDEVQRIKAETWGPAGAADALAAARPRLVAEGDSWFDYPPGLDILDHLRRTHKYPIIKLSKAGDTLENMVYGTEYNRDFSRNPIPFGTLISTVSREKPAAVLFSAGGNDIAGDDLAGYLNHRDSGRPPLQQDHLLDVIHGFAKAAYERAATEIWKVAPEALFVTHGYGHRSPTAGGVQLPSGTASSARGSAPRSRRKTSSRSSARDHEEDHRRVQRDARGRRDPPGCPVRVHRPRGSITDADWVNELHLSSAATSEWPPSSRVGSVASPAAPSRPTHFPSRRGWVIVFTSPQQQGPTLAAGAAGL